MKELGAAADDMKLNCCCDGFFLFVCLFVEIALFVSLISTRSFCDCIFVCFKEKHLICFKNHFGVERMNTCHKHGLLLQRRKNEKHPQRIFNNMPHIHTTTRTPISNTSIHCSLFSFSFSNFDIDHFNIIAAALVSKFESIHNSSSSGRRCSSNSRKIRRRTSRRSHVVVAT